ncbi:MAG: YitT family protein [Clostridiales bacterium]|nr:YitT family protein [Clostridiales bacterium]
MKVFTKRNLKYIFDAVLVVVGTFLMGIAFNVFLNANKISPSGFSGLSAIISNVLLSSFGINIPASIFYLGINTILFIFSFKKMGLNFAINSAIGVVSYSVFMEVCNFDIGLSSGDLLLCAIYGGVVMGIGLGLVFRGHGSTGGSDMLANILGKKFRFLTVGNLVLIVDAIVLVLSFIAYGNLTLSLYSLIAIWIMTKMSDVIISGVQGVRAYYIISSNYEEISNLIMTKLERGVTGFEAEGMYTKKEQKVLMTVVTRAESVKLRQLVANADRDAFVYSTPISEAMGYGFLPLKNDGKDYKHKKVTKVTDEQTLTETEE